MKFKKLIIILKEDYQLNSFESFMVLFFYRVKHYLWEKKLKILFKIVSLLFFIFKLLTSSQSQISYKCYLGRRLRLPHKAFGVVISKYAIVGDDVTIYHNVTIGINESYNSQNRIIRIDNECYISCGVVIISCEIGKRCKIVPNRSVYQDMPDDSIAK